MSEKIKTELCCLLKKRGRTITTSVNVGDGCPALAGSKTIYLDLVLLRAMLITIPKAIPPKNVTGALPIQKSHEN